VQKQYSGSEHGLVRGIGVVNLVHSDGDEFYPIDYRIYALSTNGIRAQTILFDGWYASVTNLKLVAFLQMVFIAPIKENRLVSLSREQGYIHVQDIDWTPQRLTYGVSVKLKELPLRVRLFKVVATIGDIDWMITNAPEPQLTTQDIRDENALLWHIEQFHRELKQLTVLKNVSVAKRVLNVII
jgi:hypothetical protein